MTFKGLASRIGLAMLGLLLGIGLLELLASQFLPLVWVTRFTIPDPLLGWKHPPNTTFTTIGFSPPVLEYRTRLTTNSLGFNDREHSVEKASGLNRVLILGDSFAETAQVPPPQSLSVLLERHLNADGLPAEVINLAMLGFGTDQELLAFRHIGVRFRPDVILLFFTPKNDIGDNSMMITPQYYGWAFNQKPFFIYANGHLTLVPFDYERVLASRNERHGFKGFLHRHSNLYHVAREIMFSNDKLFRFFLAFGLVSDSHRVRSRFVRYPYNLEIYLQEYPAVWEEAWRVTKALLLALQAEVSTTGARLAVVVAPSPELVYDDFWEGLRESYPAMKEAAWDLRKPVRTLLGFCREHDLLCLDLTPAMRAHVARTGERLHFKFDGHWNEAGNRFVADQVHQFFQRSRLLDADSHRR